MPTASDSPPALVSAIVIARNEQATVGDCLRSARAALGERPHELILVDSDSDDDTVANAAAVGGVRIVRLPPHRYLGPALGRYAGHRAARGDWLLFLDGDMVLLPDWFAAAAAALRDDPQLAGVAGDMQHQLPAPQPAVGRGDSIVSHDYPASDYVAADYLGGAALYRAAALAHSGSFNPFLYSCEEEDLGARLRKAGFTLRRLRRPMTRHHPRHVDRSVAELWRRIGRRFFFGMGQMSRHALSYRLPIARPLGAISRHLLIFGYVCVGLAALLAGVSGYGWLWAGLWLGGFAALFALFALKAGELRRPAYYFAEWLCAGPSVTAGLLRPPRRVEQFEPIWADISAATPHYSETAHE